MAITLTRELLEKMAADGCGLCGQQEGHNHGPLYVHVPHPRCSQLHAWYVFYRAGSLFFECAECHAQILQVNLS